jgi:hypothetical protein
MGERSRIIVSSDKLYYEQIAVNMNTMSKEETVLALITELRRSMTVIELNSVALKLEPDQLGEKGLTTIIEQITDSVQGIKDFLDYIERHVSSSS